jgi:hypothetical protein
MQANQLPAAHSSFQLPEELVWLKGHRIESLDKGGMGSVFLLRDGTGNNIAVVRLIRP